MKIHAKRVVTRLDLLQKLASLQESLITMSPVILIQKRDTNVPDQHSAFIDQISVQQFLIGKHHFFQHLQTLDPMLDLLSLNLGRTESHPGVLVHDRPCLLHKQLRLVVLVHNERF